MDLERVVDCENLILEALREGRSGMSAQEQQEHLMSFLLELQALRDLRVGLESLIARPTIDKGSVIELLKNYERSLRGLLYMYGIGA